MITNAIKKEKSNSWGEQGTRKEKDNKKKKDDTIRTPSFNDPVIFKVIGTIDAVPWTPFIHVFVVNKTFSFLSIHNALLSGELLPFCGLFGFGKLASKLEFLRALHD